MAVLFTTMAFPGPPSPLNIRTGGPEPGGGAGGSGGPGRQNGVGVVAATVPQSTS